MKILTLSLLLAAFPAVAADACCTLGCKAGFDQPACTSPMPTCAGDQWTCFKSGTVRCSVEWDDPCCTGTDPITCSTDEKLVCTGTQCTAAGKPKCQNGQWECTKDCSGHTNVRKCPAQTCPGTLCNGWCDQPWTGNCTSTVNTSAFYYATVSANHNTYAASNLTANQFIAVQRDPTVVLTTENTRACRYGIPGTVGRAATTQDPAYACRRGKHTTYPSVVSGCAPDVVHCAGAGSPAGPVDATAAQLQGTGTVTQTQTAGTKRAGAATVEIWQGTQRTVEYGPAP